VTRAVHDRYAASRRNPWNEVECGDHYARSMASYGVFLAVCGFEYHGPDGHLGFAPRLTPEDFRAPFTAAEGWGTFAQQQDGGAFTATTTLKSGRLRLRTLALHPTATVARVAATLDGQPVPAALSLAGGCATVTFAEALTLGAGQRLAIHLT
jgi:non-lysosomal glucosylceramidase